MMISTLPILKYTERFEDIRIYESQWMPKGAGIALPGFGIIIYQGEQSPEKRKALLRHEFGHFLQAKKTGVILFYFRIGIPSLLSTVRNGKRGQRHRDFWTEVWADQLAREYFRNVR